MTDRFFNENLIENFIRATSLTNLSSDTGVEMLTWSQDARNEMNVQDQNNESLYVSQILILLYAEIYKHGQFT